MTARLGWLPDLPDHRDLVWQPTLAAASLPDQVDLRPRCPPVLTQLSLRDCTANALANAHLFEQHRQGLPDARLASRLFIYWNERVALGTQVSDSGATIRGGIKTIAHLGACPESLWAYDIALFATRPTAQCFAAATPHRAVSYHRLQRDLSHLRACLAEGFPFVFGFTTYTAFDSPDMAAQGVLSMPKPDEHAAGGHAVMCVGYDLAARTFLAMNSWGTDWGQAGCFTLPFDYLMHEHLSEDFWTLRLLAG